ncbi:spore coat protein U domain-containing protein [Sphingomonadaceae bacterium OTU29LAMAA1]|nr:spore coat protein U domain-containing protein [Sphingomonadaceae bacterium OTU29LAMAA1]
MSRFRWIGLFAAMAAACCATPAAAALCNASAAATRNAGPYSPAAVQAGKVPAIVGSAGLTCDASLLVILGSNSVRATFSSLNGLKLKGASTDIAYTAAADPGGTVALTQDKTTEYMQNNVINALGLLGANNGMMPLYLTIPSGAQPPVGQYKDVITITWDWRICRGISALICIGGYETPPVPVKSVITVTLDVQAVTMTMALTSVTTWDPVKGTAAPLDFPGAKGRTTLRVDNPDLVPLDGVVLIYKVPNRTSVALDGDGTNAPVIGFADGQPSSGIAFNYTPGSTTDDVDFSTDNGATWAYAPVAGNRTSEANVTHLRFRPRNALNPSSGFSVSFPYLVR